MAIADDRAKAVELALAQIEKQFGKGSIVRLGSKEALVPIAVISTGSISFDAALGVGGIPRGRVTEVYGPESSGKTTITLQIIAEAQKLGGLAAFVDAEHALDPAYARKLGVDIDNLLVSQPDSGEQALEITEALVRSGAIDVLVVDSVAALVPQAELDGEMGDSHVGLQARLMSQALRKLTGTVSKSRTALIFINQIREKIGVMFGNPETTTGGRALPRGGVRHSLRRGHQPRRRRAGSGGGQQYRGKVRLLVQLRRRAHRPGPRNHSHLPQGQQGSLCQAGRRSAQGAQHRRCQS